MWILRGLVIGAIMLTLTGRVAFGVNEAWLFERFQVGDVDTIQSLLNEIPDSSAGGLFFRGIFEPDGERARFYYDRIVALWQDSEAEAWALERLWQYHWSRGNAAQAQRYYNFLEQRHPDHPGLTETLDFTSRSGVFELMDKPADNQQQSVKRNMDATRESGRWRVQLGAFSRREGAKVIARKVIEFGPVDLIEKWHAEATKKLPSVNSCLSREGK